MFAALLPSESTHRADALRAITLTSLTTRASKHDRFHTSTDSLMAIWVANPCSSWTGSYAVAEVVNDSRGIARIAIATNGLLPGPLNVEATRVGESSLDLTI